MPLTIAIPTYNRNAVLVENLALLLPQLTPDCRLRILDNCSDQPVAHSLKPLMAEFPHVDWAVTRNRTNIGANANILRCYESCETDWIWVLGDDDRVRPEAIKIIFDHLHSHPDCIFFNFAFDGLRPETIVTRGIDDFVARLDLSANLPWISSAVARASVLLPNLKFGYQYSYSMLPHVATLLVSIGDSGVCCLSREQISSPASVDERWSMLNLALGYPILYDLPLKSETRDQLARKLLVTYYGESISLRILVQQLLLLLPQGHDGRSLGYYYDQVCRRAYPPRLGVRRIAQRLFYRAVVRFPRLSYSVAAAVYRAVKGKELAQHRLADRFSRM